ncbi:MAG: mismatch repair protein MutS2 [Eubacteriales bacterium]|nr:mismatch repair protein MutS2 [Eubacteriales bacterium]
MDRDLVRLDYDKIVEMLAAEAVTAAGREKCLALRPLAEKEVVETRLAETEEGRLFLVREGENPLEPLPDLTGILLKLEKGGVLQAADFLLLRRLLQLARRIKRAFLAMTARYPLLGKLAADIVLLPELEEDINRLLDEDGFIRDDASPALRRIREGIREHTRRIKSYLEEFIRSPEAQKILQEPLYTLRSDRYVLPVKQEFRQRVPGIVHDQSASGATLYIEPAAVVEMTNRLQGLRREEEEEIFRLLRELTEKAATKLADLAHNYRLVAEADFILARGSLARRMEGTVPRVNQEGRLRLYKARHPLLGKRAVPVDILLGEGYDFLVITGPNTGGKTVTLKTAGLLVLMGVSGLAVPAASGSEIPLVDRVFADIGDEQSIEQSLSTFSSHMVNIIRILKEATPRSLVLLDELGAGTDPAEGAALAMAILETLVARGVRGMATTHYSELKYFAYTHPRLENAAVEFDPHTLKPTYRLTIGQPGRSSAFAIAAGLGLMPEVVERARHFLSREELEVGELIAGLQEKQRQAEAARQEAEALRQELKREKEKLAEERREMEEKKEAVLARAREEAQELLRRTRREVDRILKEIHRRRQEGDAAGAEELRREFKEIEKEMAKREKVPAAAGKKDWQPGETVYVTTLNQTGVLQALAGNQATVAVGPLKVTVPVSALSLPPQDVSLRQEPVISARPWLEKKKTVRPELDLRGQTVEEALENLARYLDDLFLTGLSKATIIHGVGTGALKKAVRAYLKENLRRGSFRPGFPGEGGDGVTVIELD